MGANQVDIKVVADMSQFNTAMKTSAQEVEQFGEKTQMSVNEFKDAVKNSTQSLGEMKRELRELRNQTFFGKTEEEIKQVRARMAELTDGIGDFQAQIKTASADRIPALVGGLQGIVASAQGVTAALSIAGVQTEKLDKTMVQLIGVSQALSTMYDLYEKQTLKVALATAKDTASKVTNAITTKALTLATNTQNAALKKLYLTMAANPVGVVILAVAALAAGIYVLTNRMTAAEKTTKAFNEAQDKIAEGSAKEIINLEVLQKKIADANTSQSERVKLVEELQKQYPDYISNMDKERIIAGESEIVFIKLAEAIKKKAYAEALAAVARDEYIKQINNQIDLNRRLTDTEKKTIDYLMDFVPVIKGAVAGWEEYKELDLAKDIEDSSIVIDELTTKIAEQEKVIRTFGKAYEETQTAKKEAAEKEKKRLEEEKKKADELKKIQEEAYKKELDRKINMYNLSWMLVNKLSEAQKVGKLQEIESIEELEVVEEDVNAAILEGKRLLKDQEWELSQDEMRMLDEQFKKGLIGEKGYAAAVITIKKKQAEEEREIYLQKVKAIEDSLNVGVQAYQAYSDHLDKEDAARLESISATRDADLENLKEEYDKGLISKKKYEDAVVGVELNADKESKKIQNEAAKRQREIAIFQQAIATGVAIANGIKLVYSSSSTWYEAVIAAAGIAAEIIALMATADGYMQDAPQYAKGGTGVINGASHSSGGVPFFGGEAEGGERWAIFSKTATSKNSGLESLIDAVNSHQLNIDNDFLHRIKNGNDVNNIVVVSNFKGDEDLKIMRQIMERNDGRDILMPDGRIKKGIIKRRLN